MAELQRANPQSARQTGVAFNTPDSRGQLASLEASSKALSLQEQGKQNIARSLRGLAEGVEHLGGVAATVSANKAKQVMDMATRLDMQSYTLALGEAQRRAQEEFSSHTYGTAEEAAEAYRNTIGKYISEVDNLFFPADENDRVAGNYFRYADALGLTPDHPMMLMAKQQTEAAGTNYALNKWNEEDMAVNTSITQRACETWIAQGCDDVNVFYKILKAGVGKYYVNDKTLRKMAEECVQRGGITITGGSINAHIKSTPGVYQKNVEARLANGEDFGKATDEAREEVKKAALAHIDQLLESHAEKYGNTEEFNKWAENVRKKSEAEITKLLKASNDDANKNRKENVLAQLDKPFASGDEVQGYDASFVKAFWADNTYTEDKKAGGGREVVRDRYGNEVDLGDADRSEAMFHSMMLRLSKLTYDNDRDFKIAEQILLQASGLEREFHDRIRDMVRSGLDFSVNASPEEKKQKESIDASVELFMGEKTGTLRSIKDGMSGDDLQMAIALCDAIQGVPVNARRRALTEAYEAYKKGTLQKLNGDQAFNFFAFGFDQPIPYPKREPQAHAGGLGRHQSYSDKPASSSEVLPFVTGFGH